MNRRARRRRQGSPVRIAAGIVTVLALAYCVTANAVVRREVARTEDLVADARDDVTDTQRSIGVTGERTEEEFAVGIERGAERDRVNDAFTVARADLAASQGTLTANEQALAVQTTRIGAFGTCISGVQQTLAQIGAGDRAGASATLAATSLPCNTAIGATGGLAPVFAFDFPDPFVLRADGVYYAYSTNAGAGDIQVAQSPDLRQWTFVGNGLAGLPSWAGPNRTWGPSVLARPSPFGTAYVAYYTVRVGAGGPQCITRAVSSSPAGPFVDDSSGPLICPRRGDAIDPSPFVGLDGTAFLLWRGEEAGIWAQPLSSSGLALEGQPRPLIGADQTWEGSVVEGPAMVGHEGRYYLLYSGNEWNSPHYAIGYAVCDSPLGPCAKPSSSLLFGSLASIIGPGGQEVFSDAAGGLWVAYHAYTQPNVGYPNSRRLHLAPLGFSAGVPVVSPDS